MDERQILSQRLATLDALLDGSGGLSGAGGAQIAERLSAGWAAERRLIQRLLAEAGTGDVRATIQLWRERTQGFLAKSQDPDPGWTDASGQRWDARGVLMLLDDVEERLDSWQLADLPLEDDGAG
jgi:hypothetical protein